MPKKPKRVLNSASARNGTPKAIVIKHAGGASALRASRLDRRSAEFRLVTEHASHLTQHIGGEDLLTEPLKEIITVAAEAKLLRKLAWGAVLREGVLDENGHPSGALAAYLSSASKHVELLRLLGLTRRAKTLSLEEFVRAHDTQQEVEER